MLPGFEPEAVDRRGGDARVARRDRAAAGSIPVVPHDRPRRRRTTGRRCPPNVVTTYGMTETGSGVVYDGRPLDGVDVRIDGDGQIHLRGPMLLRGYRDGTDPLSTAGSRPATSAMAPRRPRSTSTAGAAT